MEFKMFRKGDRVGRNMVSIRPTGAIFFNSGFYKKEGIVNYKYIMMFYDVDAFAIAFKLTNSEKEGCYRIAHQNNCGTVRATVFFNVFLEQLNTANYSGDEKCPLKVMRDIVGKYTPEYDSEKNIYVVRFECLT